MWFKWGKVPGRQQSGMNTHQVSADSSWAAELSLEPLTNVPEHPLRVVQERIQHGLVFVVLYQSAFHGVWAIGCCLVLNGYTCIFELLFRNRKSKAPSEEKIIYSYPFCLVILYYCPTWNTNNQIAHLWKGNYIYFILEVNKEVLHVNVELR